ncbi:tRNA lysidine(34) synthetase TilS [Daejeonella sp. H1SJ63]|jgi:tRNA(Ile)-lysidine synthase|uniref:tRNA lysidine(34) synthetase TilS n=1 Tax=Daejeonella sp. H1SJ63 TaxID=3034145 RepID=UPI0023EB21D5|nr:tRNA lysidine(34) synthetase TilS [Daejeonella sp. H1SJ63]
MTVIQRFQNYIKEHALFRDNEPVLLAVSGGRDSVLMAHLFKSAGYTFGIAHCNFGLRGNESEQDEAFCTELAQKLDVPFHSVRFDTAEFAGEHRISIQMAARDLRYQWLEKIRSESGYRYIGVAHHQNDATETMLLNLTRGTGISGLHGILPKKGKLIRPLLFLSREEINDIFNKEKYTFREDSSNLSSKYARNKIRIEVIPVLKQLNPALEHTFEENRKRFADLEVLLEQRVAELRDQLFKKINSEEIEISLPDLQKLRPLDTLMYELFKPYGFSEPVLTDLQKSWYGEAGKIFQSVSHQLLLDRNKLILSTIEETETEETLIDQQNGYWLWQGKTFKSIICTATEFQLKKDKNLAQLDLDLLQFPLKLRSWKNGDHFQPLGLKGTKKLSDFFIEQKISLNHKKDIGILENNNGDILWVSGLRISERYKISSGTKKVFILEQFK